MRPGPAVATLNGSAPQRSVLLVVRSVSGMSRREQLTRRCLAGAGGSGNPVEWRPGLTLTRVGPPASIDPGGWVGGSPPRFTCAVIRPLPLPLSKIFSSLRCAAIHLGVTSRIVLRRLQTMWRDWRERGLQYRIERAL